MPHRRSSCTSHTAARMLRAAAPRRLLSTLAQRTRLSSLVAGSVFVASLSFSTVEMAAEAAGAAAGSGAGSAATTTDASRPHRAVVVGATGGVGRRVVHFLALDPRVEAVTALTRRDRDDAAKLFDLDGSPLAKVKWAVVDFEKLTDAGEGADKLAGHTIGFSALGLYTRDARDETHFRRVEQEYNVAAAKAMVAGGGDRFAYLSGAGAKKGGFLMFARVKADAEEALRNVTGMSQSCAMRPGFIRNRVTPDHPVTNFFGGIFEALGSGCQTDDIAKAMVHSTVSPKGSVQDVLENNDIIKCAREYEAALALVAASGGASGSGDAPAAASADGKAAAGSAASDSKTADAGATKEGEL